MTIIQFDNYYPAYPRMWEVPSWSEGQALQTSCKVSSPIKLLTFSLLWMEIHCLSVIYRRLFYNVLSMFTKCTGSSFVISDVSTWTGSSHFLIASWFSPTGTHLPRENISKKFQIYLHFHSLGPFSFFIYLLSAMSFLYFSYSQFFLTSLHHSKMPEIF